MSENYERWNQFAPLGLLLMGLGLSLIGHATASKARRRGWFFKGTLGLIAFNAGASVFGEAVKSRTLYELELARLRQPAHTESE